MRLPRHLPAIWKLVLLLLAPAVFAAIPSAVVENGPDLCLWKALLSVECWGCGMTRAVHRLLWGDWRTALQFNPRVFPVVAFLGAEWLRQIHRHVSASWRHCGAGRRP